MKKTAIVIGWILSILMLIVIIMLGVAKWSQAAFDSWSGKTLLRSFSAAARPREFASNPANAVDTDAK